MPGLLGLDIGDKQVGTALADSSVGIALPHQTFNRAKGDAERRILGLLSERGIATVIAGLPLSEYGEESEQCEKIRNFCRRLQKRAAFTLEYVDEHLTSFQAEQQLEAARIPLRRAKKAGQTDALSASIILQSYLDSQRPGK